MNAGAVAEKGHAVAARSLAALAPRVRLIARATPLNLSSELLRLGEAWALGREEAPRFEYAAPADMGDVARALERFASAYEGPWRDLYRARAAELLLEASACEAVGTPAFRALATKRYPRRDAFDDEAETLAAEWSHLAEDPAPPGAVLSDDESDPRSLLRSMRRAVGEQRLAVRVVASGRVAALAATGDGIIYVATGRRLTAEETARTVLHEVLGHAAPQDRAKCLGLPLLVAGTAFGADDQEGRALLLEERAGFLSPSRRRELCLRHIAARAMAQGADFVEVARMLRERGASIPPALRITARVFRGGGLGREAAYLPAKARVQAALARSPYLEDIFAAGRVSVEAARALHQGGAL